VFLDNLINYYPEANKAFETIKLNQPYDDKLMKDYFAFALQQYSDYLNLG